MHDLFDELERLRQAVDLQRLLHHYAVAGTADWEVWQDRLMHLPGAGSADLTRLHGELIAFGWVEQNTVQTPVLRAGVVASCYRVTTAGLRALREVRQTPAACDGADGVCEG